MKVYDVTLTSNTINVNGWEMQLNHVRNNYITYRLLKTRIDVSDWFWNGGVIFSTTFIVYAQDICEHVIKYGTRN